MKLVEVHSVAQAGRWMQGKGFVVSEHPAFGIVNQVHGPTSLHYVAQALDVNRNFHSANDAREWNTETEALKWLYKHLLKAAKNHKWPLDEMFFGNLGFLKETPLVNHAIGGHDGHLHIGFQKKEW